MQPPTLSKKLLHQLLMIHFLLTIAAYSTDSPTDPSSPSARKFTFFAWYPGPNTVITRVKSTMIVPQELPTGPNGLQSLWPGLQPSDGSLVFQNVVSNQVAGSWGLFLTECCDPLYPYTEYTPLYPGDLVTTDFMRDMETGNWTVRWSVDRGVVGMLENATLLNGTVGDIVPNTWKPLDTFFLSLELGSGAQWEFGPVVWQNIVLEANTSDINWCHNPHITVTDFNLTGPVVGRRMGGNMTSCTITELIFVLPN